MHKCLPHSVHTHGPPSPKEGTPRGPAAKNKKIPGAFGAGNPRRDLSKYANGARISPSLSEVGLRSSGIVFSVWMGNVSFLLPTPGKCRFWNERAPIFPDPRRGN